MDRRGNAFQIIRTVSAIAVAGLSLGLLDAKALAQIIEGRPTTGVEVTVPPTQPQQPQQLGIQPGLGYTPGFTPSGPKTAAPSYQGDAPTGDRTESGVASPQLSPIARLAAELSDARDSDLISLEILRKIDRARQGEGPQ